MPILSRPSMEARLAIGYVTAGAIIDVWTGIWYAYMRNYPPPSESSYYICAGVFLTGLVLLCIGLALGRIGRAARQAELPPEEMAGASAQAEMDAAARAPMVTPVVISPAALPGAVAPAATPAAAPPVATVVPDDRAARVARAVNQNQPVRSS